MGDPGDEDSYYGIEKQRISPQGNLLSRSTGTAWTDQRLALFMCQAGGASGNPVWNLSDGVERDTLLLRPPEIDEWVHLAPVFDGKEMRGYKNGVLLGRRPQTVIPKTTGIPLMIGGLARGFGGGHFNGLIDEVRIYSRPLSQKEIHAQWKYFRDEWVDRPGWYIRTLTTGFLPATHFKLSSQSALKVVGLILSPMVSQGS